MKLLIESGRGIDIAIIKSKLRTLSELERIISSKVFCRRQSILSLLDENRTGRCSNDELKCDNCHLIQPTIIRDVTTEVKAVLTFISHNPQIDVLKLRKVLSAEHHDILNMNSSVEGLLISWPVDEIAQFTDYLLTNGMLQNKGWYAEGVPVNCLELATHGTHLISQPETRLLLPVYVMSNPGAISPFKSHCSRFHDIQKRRFLPKVILKTPKPSSDLV